MVDFANLGPAGLINELDETLDVIYNLAGALGIGISPDGEFKAKVDKEDNETHRKRAKLALAQVKVRDLVEAIAGSPEAKAQEPLNLSLTMGKLINMYCLMELNNDAKQYFDALKPLIKTGASYWQLAACLNLLVIGYLDDGRFDQASSIYYENLKLSHIEEMAHGLVRSAFNLISRFVMCQQLARAHKIYNTMKLYCPNKPDLSLVSKGAKAEIAPELGPEAGPEVGPGADPEAGGDVAGREASAAENMTVDGNPAGEPRAEAADGPTRKPVLTLVNPLSGGEKPARFSPELLDDESDYEDANLVRGQAAINLLSGYALTGQASKALDVYKTITEHDNVNEFVPIKSMAGLNLIRAFIQSRRWKEGAKYFREMLSLRKKADNSVLLAKAAVELIGFADKKNLAEAEEICSDLEGLSDEEDFILEHSRAVGNLIFIYGDFEELDKALALYESLDRFGDSLDILAVKAKSTVNLMSDYCVAKRPDLAEGLFQRLNDFGDHEVLAPSKVQGAHNLMAAYLKANEASRAEELFKGMARYGNGPGVGILRARAVFSLVSYYIHKKELEKTLEIYKLFDELGEAEDVFLEKGKALVNLVSFVGGLGLTTLAKTHFLEYHEKAVVHLQKMRMPMDDDYDFDEDFFENNASLAKLRNFPIGGFSEIVNHYVDFENDYYDIGLYNDTDFDTHDFEEESISSLLGKASFNLILDYTESGNFPEAEAIYMTMFDLDLVNRMVAHDIAQAGHLIISSAVPLGKWPLVMRVFESLDRLPKTQDINHQRCLVAIIILTYNNQRKLQISKTIYDILMEIQPKGPFGGYISKAALDTVVGLINEKQYEEALVVYKSMGDLGRALKTLERRAQAATYLIKAYESLGWLTEAKKVYQSMSLLGMGAKVTKLRLKAAKTLANLMNHSGLKEAADQLHEDTCGFRRFKKEGMNQEESKDGKSKKTLH